MKKLLTAAAALAAVLIAAVALLSLPRAERDGPPRVTGTCSTEGPLQGGAATVPLTFAGPVPIGGFPRLRWTAEGTRDPLAVRALVLSGPGCAVGLVSAEILLVPGALERAVSERTRDLGLGALVVGATHTHAGPGGYWDSFVAARIATGPYDPAILERIADAMAQALRQAAAARRPVQAEAAEVDARALARNRTGAAADGRLVVLRLRAGPEVVGEIASLGTHATLLGAQQRLLSGDWPGALMRLSAAPRLFFPGALGDQSAAGPETASPERYAEAVAARIERAPLRPLAPALAAARAEVPLPWPSPGGAPRLLRPAAGRLLGGGMPAQAAATAVRIGPLLLVAVPAEPVEEVGRGWREAAGPGAEILSLCGAYAGYVETPERMARDDGETARTYYGPAMAARLEAAIRMAAGAAAAPAR
ncbi:MAG: hypothetical protein HZB56_13385 [Deltaproteobacteria bacterium]|nr:hypothetical protein [Deltaproteobacteria bacterium]